MKKFRQWLSVQVAKNPGGVILAAILLFNIAFFLLSALVISSLSLDGTQRMGFLQAAFYTVTMILDAGCIQFVIEDIGQAGVGIAVACLIIILIGMVTFTGAVIGYITNYISNFIAHANAGSRRLRISNHIVILNWNTRASEVINDLLYSSSHERVVVLVGGRRTEIEKEIEERLADTVMRENLALWAEARKKGLIRGLIHFRRNKFKNHVTVLVREGDVFSSKQLHDICLDEAKTAIILGNDINNSICRFEQKDFLDESARGNVQTVKTLMQVADITSAKQSRDNQRIIVEITDDWTWDLVDRIIKSKQVAGKCNIVPVRVNKILGQILSQFSLMPELNTAYRELFSNKGMAFFSVPHEMQDDVDFVRGYLADHRHAIPLTFMDGKDGIHAYFAAGSEKDIHRTNLIREPKCDIKLNADYWIEKKNVIILGHNSKCKAIMEGFAAFRDEWNYKDGSDEILRIIVVDDEDSLERMNHYREYPFVIRTVPASIYDRDLICATIDEFTRANAEDTSILILSDDSALNENIDSNALANLVYVQDIKKARIAEDPDFDPESIDLIVEIIDPKHHDIVSSYSVNNVVISNRYISKMITQIGQKEALFDFYTDILTYDTGDTGDEGEADGDSAFKSKEIYAKKVSLFFDEIPESCPADMFIRAVFEASVSPDLPPEKRNPTVALGYVKPGGRMVLFEGDQAMTPVVLGKKDKLIVFSNH